MKSLKQQKSLKRFIGPRMWGLLFIIAAPLALGFKTGGAQVVPEIDNALACGRLGEVSDIAPGNALFRVDVNLNNFPNAICNDGSGDTLWDWWIGQQPQQVVYPYTGPGPAPSCN